MGAIEPFNRRLNFCQVTRQIDYNLDTVTETNMRSRVVLPMEVAYPAPRCRVLFTIAAQPLRTLGCLLVLWLLSASEAGALPAYPLKVSANGRYLVDSNNQPSLMIGDAPQALFVKLSEAEAGLFLTNRASRGFNSLWVNLLCSTNNGGLLNGVTTNGIAPFTNTISGSSKYDLTAPNENYFARVDRIIAVAAQLGIQIMLDPLETSVGVWTSTALTNGTNRCRTYGQYLGNRYKNFNNIIWWSGNDFQDWTNAASDAVIRSIAQGILDVDTRHLHTLLLDYPVSGSLNNSNWNSIAGLNASYTYWPTYAQVLDDYNRTNFVPTFLAEAHYEFEELYNAYGSPEVMRRQAYWSLLSGACGQFMGNHFTWQFLAGWQTNMDTTGSLQMQNVKSLFESHRWYDLVPDQNHTLVTSGYGTYATGGSLTNNNYATAARTADGTLALVYMPTVRTITVNMSRFSVPVMAKWFDPASGVYATIAGSPFTNASSRTFTPTGTNSGGVGDWVLVLEPVDSSPPSISAVPDQTTDAGMTVGPIPFTVTDNEVDSANLLVQAASSNPSLLPTDQILLGGSGSNRTVTLMPASNQLGNATVTLTVSDGTLTASNSFVLTVNPPSLTVTAASFSRSYGATNPVLTGSIVGLMPGDNITANFTTSATTNSPVGVYPISVTLSGAGGVLGNYVLTINGGILTVTQAVLVAAADNLSRTFAEPNPPLTISYAGFVNGETESALAIVPAASTTATNDSAPGDYAITLAGGAGSNYSLVLSNGVLTVTPPVVVISSAVFLDAGHLKLSGSGGANMSYTLQSSTNLASWGSIGTISTDGAGAFEYVDDAVAGVPQRFYRVSWP